MKEILGEIEKTSCSQLIVEKLRRALAEGKLKIGDKLPPERELAVQLGVSRTSLREAIRVLAAYGILESNQGEGTFVTDRFAENVFEFLGFGSTLSRENFRYLLQTRDVIETGCIEIAVDNFNEKTRERMEQLIQGLERERDRDKLGLLDAGFHELIVAMTNNPLLTQVYRMIHKMLISATSKVIAYPNGRQIAIQGHREILDCFLNKDKERCKQAVHRHLKDTENLIAEYFTE